MITWSEIENECGDYRDGLVAVFRKYEGQTTDEKDGQNRTVKVTASSFARHIGIPERTFLYWVSAAAQAVLPEDRVQKDAVRARTDVRRLPPDERAKLAAEMLAEPEVAEQVVNDDTARSNVHQALDRRYEQAPKPYANQAETAPHDHTVEVLVSLRGISAAIKKATDVILSGPQLDSADDLLAVVDWQANALNIIRTALTGRSDVDAELAKILENGS